MIAFGSNQSESRGWSRRWDESLVGAWTKARSQHSRPRKLFVVQAVECSLLLQGLATAIRLPEGGRGCIRTAKQQSPTIAGSAAALHASKADSCLHIIRAGE